MTTRPKAASSSSWTPTDAAPLMSTTGGTRTTDIDGATLVVVPDE